MRMQPFDPGTPGKHPQLARSCTQKNAPRPRVDAERRQVDSRLTCRMRKIIVKTRAKLLSASLALLLCASARGATFTVTNTNDSGPGSLRQAIGDANNTFHAWRFARGATVELERAYVRSAAAAVTALVVRWRNGNVCRIDRGTPGQQRNGPF
jgi:hypothetical protein